MSGYGSSRRCVTAGVLDRCQSCQDKICAEVCVACAESCEAMKDDEMMQECADTCCRCGASCRQMAHGRLIDHHQMAVEMAELCLGKATHAGRDSAREQMEQSKEDR